MTLTFCRDLAAADWIAHSAVPWWRLVTFGPAGFDAYARLRLLPDPQHPGQSENDVDAEEWRPGQLPTLFDALATHTATPDDCYFCVWEGFGNADDDVVPNAAAYRDDASLARPDARPGLAPESPVSAAVPRVVVPHRAYWLFRGPLADVGTWDTAVGWPGHCRLDRAEPAFVWPGDHAWCVAKDVDPHWAGIGGNQALITQLVSDPRLDVVAAHPAEEQPVYR